MSSTTPALQVTGIDHVTLVVADLERTRKFPISRELVSSGESADPLDSGPRRKCPGRISGSRRIRPPGQNVSLRLRAGRCDNRSRHPEGSRSRNEGGTSAPSRWLSASLLHGSRRARGRSLFPPRLIFERYCSQGRRRISRNALASGPQTSARDRPIATISRHWTRPSGSEAFALLLLVDMPVWRLWEALVQGQGLISRHALASGPGNHC
jgi:hypothetical protein